MTFRLFGTSVEIQMGFWITAGLLGLGLLQKPALFAIWVGVVLVSVLVHEFGHAFAIMRHKIEPEIALHWMGGTTSWRMVLPLRRIHHVIISLAGPFAGFAFAGLIFGARFAAYKLAPETMASISPYALTAVDMLIDVNLKWGIFNLVPVLPLDGGHVLEHALGPKRVRLTSAISFIVGGSLALICLFFFQSFLGAFIFGMGAYQSYMRFRGERSAPAHMPSARPAPQRAADPLDPATAGLLRQARDALAAEQVERAIELSQQILAGRSPEPGAPPAPPPARAAHAALEVIAWASLLAGRIDDAYRAVDAARRIDSPDPALAAAILLARREIQKARRVLEAARAAGDDRKEVVGPLIRILIEQGEISRAAAVAYDIVDSLSEDDARQVAALAFEGGAYDWAARLYEVIFQRVGHADDAYNAARALAKGGSPDRALELLRRAVAAGFSDRARAWSDAALEALRSDRGLDTVLPRP
jgi:Zn-dependent protease